MRPVVVLLVGGVLLGLRALGSERLARLLRSLDQRSGLFSPRGATLYALVAPRLLRGLYGQVADDVAAGIGVPPSGDRPAILEVGSGPGDLSLAIARRLPSAAVTGVDLAPAMVATAARAAERAGLEHQVRFLEADAAALPLESASFDAAISTLSLHHWADPAAAFAELHRVLRPGGLALIYDVRSTTYSRRDVERFLAVTSWAGATLQRDVSAARLLRLPAFVRITLRRDTLPESGRGTTPR